jgi:hypothetical protein
MPFSATSENVSLLTEFTVKEKEPSAAVHVDANGLEVAKAQLLARGLALRFGRRATSVVLDVAYTVAPATGVAPSGANSFPLITAGAAVIVTVRAVEPVVF